MVTIDSIVSAYDEARIKRETIELKSKLLAGDRPEAPIDILVAVYNQLQVEERLSELGVLKRVTPPINKERQNTISYLNQRIDELAQYHSEEGLAVSTSINRKNQFKWNALGWVPQIELHQTYIYD
ncbi:MAG: hypothetical protein WC254_00820, partial [Candidatus Woesearchaeota archaeon]